MSCFQQETFSSLGDLDGQRQYPDSDVRFDHAPYFNFNDGKVKFDTNWFDNANENYGSASGVVPKSLIITKGALRRLLFYRLLDLIHPPSILPISSIISCKMIYFLLSKDLVSFIRRTRKRRVFSFTLAFSRRIILLAFFEYPASRKSSTMSIIISSLRSNIVNRSDLGISFL